MKILTNPHFLLTLTSIFWAFNTVAGRAAVGEVSPLLIVSVRWFFVSIILSILCRNQLIETWSILNKKIKWLIFMGLFGFTGFNSAYYVAAHDTIAINLGLVQGTMPAFIIIIAWIWLKDKINFTQFLGVLITFIAVLIVVCSGNFNALIELELNSGDIVMIFACTLYAIYAVGLRKKPKISALPLLTFFAYIAFLGSLPGLIYEIYSNQLILPGQKGFIILGVIIIFPSFLAQIFFMKGVEKIGPSRSGLYTNLVPVFSSLLAVFFLGEEFQFFHLLSLIMIFTGIYLFEYNQVQKLK
jgi:drug/metabolite transporter (DMT)-like permease|tara:strand:- start:46 stop:942 length:897 start_codon:yes stop_codon:yes gene_type:complete